MQHTVHHWPHMPVLAPVWEQPKLQSLLQRPRCLSRSPKHLLLQRLLSPLLQKRSPQYSFAESGRHHVEEHVWIFRLTTITVELAVILYVFFYSQIEKPQKLTIWQCGAGLVCGQGSCVNPNIYSCVPSSGACGGSCGGFCFTDISGNGVCKISLSCAGLLTCTTSADCPSTYCLQNGCGRVCASTEALCRTWNPARLFR